MWDLDAATYGWLAIAIVAGLFEVASPHFGAIFVSVGAVGAEIAAFFGYGLPVQGLTFVIVLLVSLATLRKRLTGAIGGRGVPSRTAPLIGREGIVTHAIDPVLGTGRVTVSGEDWAARSRESLAVGTTVRVMAADGIVLEVTRA